MAISQYTTLIRALNFSSALFLNTLVVQNQLILVNICHAKRFYIIRQNAT